MLCPQRGFPRRSARIWPQMLGSQGKRRKIGSPLHRCVIVPRSPRPQKVHLRRGGRRQETGGCTRRPSPQWPITRNSREGTTNGLGQFDGRTSAPSSSSRSINRKSIHQSGTNPSESKWTILYYTRS
ncbi:hypothetical protein OF83DRAFT_1160487 [Amylostereum chailletii]|nr:hypothetical protein OF83DRAFT_1160487 [Amylostereum chailletii]